MLPSQSDTPAMDELDAYAASNLDSPTRHRYLDSISGRPRWVGFNVVDSDGCFLTDWRGHDSGVFNAFRLRTRPDAG